MRRLLEVAALVAAITVATSSLAFAQAPGGWETSFGEVTAGFPADAKLRFLIATPTNAAEELAAATAFGKVLLDAKIGAMVMDDSPLGELGGLSDDEIVARAKVYPVDVVAIVRAFPGSEGSSVMLRIESQGEPTRAFALQPGEAAAAAATTAVVSEEPEATKAPPKTIETTPPPEVELEPVVEPAEAPAASPVVLAAQPWVFETEPGFGRVVEAKQVIPWPSAYEELGGNELRLDFERRRKGRTIAFVTGGLLAAAGTGLLYVTVLGSTGCVDCRNDVLFGTGVGALSTGAVALLIGFLIDAHPLEEEEVQELVLKRNAALER